MPLVPPSGQRRIQTRKKNTTGAAFAEMATQLTPYAAGFADWSGRKGYAPTMARTHQGHVIDAPLVAKMKTIRGAAFEAK